MKGLYYARKAIVGALITMFSGVVISGSTMISTQTATSGLQIRRRIVARPTVLRVDPPLFSAETKPDVDLRQDIKTLGISVRPGQAPRGTCSVFAMTFLLEYMYAKNYGFKSPDFSEEYLNHASNLATGEKVDGGFFDQINLGYQKFGIVDEALAPYKSAFDPNAVIRPEVLWKGGAIAPRLKAHFIKSWNVNTGLTAAQLLSIMVQLKSGRPVAAGLRWPVEGKLAIDRVEGVPLMKMVPASQVFDGHSIDFVGYRASKKFPGEGYFIFRNSWGTGFGDQGYGYMSFEYAMAYTNDLFQYTKP